MIFPLLFKVIKVCEHLKSHLQRLKITRADFIPLLTYLITRSIVKKGEIPYFGIKFFTNEKKRTVWEGDGPIKYTYGVLFPVSLILSNLCWFLRSLSNGRISWFLKQVLLLKKSKALVKREKNISYYSWNRYNGYVLMIPQ